MRLITMPSHNSPNGGMLTRPAETRPPALGRQFTFRILQIDPLQVNTAG